MSRARTTHSTAQRPVKESHQMYKRFAVIAATLGSALLLFAALPIASASAAPSPWWQIVTGSRPTNMWEASDNVQEIQTELGEFGGVEGAAARLDIGGDPVACLGTVDFVGETLCSFFYGGFSVTNTAAQLQTVLEAHLESAVEVTGGPVGGEPFVVKVLGRSAPSITFFQEPSFSEFGTFREKVLSPGGSGRLVLGITNLGDAVVDATGSPVTIEDELPEGVIATDIAGFSGAKHDAMDCVLDTSTLVTCKFEGTLPSYEALEVEIFVALTGEPPVAGAPGEVTVSGGNAPAETVGQEIKVSPEPTPFGIEQFSMTVEEEGGEPPVQAGSHPFQLTTTLQPNSGPATGVGGNLMVQQPAQPRDLRFPLPAGLVGNVAAVPKCTMTEFFAQREEIANQCPDASAVGVVNLSFIQPQVLGYARAAQPVFNLEPGNGEPARFGFTVAGNPIVISTAVDPDDDYRVIASAENTTQVVNFLSSTLVLWGTPGDPRHDSARGWGCAFNIKDVGPCERPAGLSEAAFLREPVSCVTPLDFQATAEPWNAPFGSGLDSAFFGGGTLHGCNRIPFDPAIAASGTSKLVASASSLDFRLDMPNAGLLNPEAIAEGQAKKVEVALPEGVTVNPSQANGLDACTPEEYARETSESAPGEGCPESAKIGRLDITTPLLEEEAHGSVYVAAPYDNPFGSLLALYLVAKIPQRGILVKQAGRVELNPKTGQLMTTFDGLPQIPFDTFNLHLFEGNRAPLVMPEKCGTYDIVAKFTPWHASNPNSPLPSEVITKTSSFKVDQGPNGGPCPSGTPPFHPGFTAGTVNNAAGSYSPFVARLTRDDGEQEFSRFSIKLPKGVIGKLAGLQLCSEAAISAAKARTGPNGGQEELGSPSCPAASQIGRTLAGAGVGPDLTYVPGKIYLAGPYAGAKLSIVAITPIKVGPFDLGTLVIRQALRVDPNTAEVTSDGMSSDPIPHILQGIVVHARDIRVYVDRDNFVLNPTNCERKAATATVISGIGQSVGVSSPFQAADCASLGFKPKLSIQLLGGTRRAATPRLKAVLTARPGDANIGRAQVTLPRSEFLEQAHIRTICTRVQFNAGGGNGEQCPKASIYGKAKAISPLLDEPLTGPVFLRSSDHELPDMVAALHSSKADINLVGRIDSQNGGIRSTFEGVPDAPVSKFVLEMQGGRKGLIVNSTNICKGQHRAIAAFKGQNGRRHEFKPLVKPQCKGKKAKKGGGRRK